MLFIGEFVTNLAEDHVSMLSAQCLQQVAEMCNPTTAGDQLTHIQWACPRSNRIGLAYHAVPITLRSK